MLDLLSKIIDFFNVTKQCRDMVLRNLQFWRIPDKSHITLKIQNVTYIWRTFDESQINAWKYKCQYFRLLTALLVFNCEKK